MSKKLAFTDEVLCKGCLLCTTVCPVNALNATERVNQKGYQVVEVDKEKCIGCGNCYRICPDYVYQIQEVE